MTTEFQTHDPVINGPNLVRQRWLPTRLAAREIVAFERRFGRQHLYLACHAALPLILTPELVNLIHINFEETINVPWFAESDFLLSALCRPLDEGFFEVEPGVREVLLAELQRQFGSDRPLEIADFLLTYLEKTAGSGLRPDTVFTYRSIAESYLDPDRAVENMLSFWEKNLASETSPMNNLAASIQMVNLMEINRDNLSEAPAREKYEGLVYGTGVLSQVLYSENKQFLPTHVNSSDSRIQVITSTLKRWSGQETTVPERSETYGDLEIHISKETEQEYRVCLFWDSVQTVDVLYLPHNSGEWALQDVIVKELGAKLVENYIFENALIHATEKNSKCRIHLRIEPEVNLLHRISWESLIVDNVMLATDVRTPFSRYFPSEKRWKGLNPNQPFNILIAIINPSNLDAFDLPAIDVPTEKQRLESVFPRSIKPTFLESPVTLDRLESELRQGYQGLHLVAHRNFSRRNQPAGIYFQNQAGQVEVKKDEVFSEMLRRLKQPPALVFLEISESAAKSVWKDSRGLGPMVIDAGVPFVVAMQTAVTAHVEREVCRVFYQRLGMHGFVDLAMNEARGALMMAGFSNLEAAAPVLFMGVIDGRLWTSATDDGTKPDVQGVDHSKPGSQGKEVPEPADNKISQELSPELWVALLQTLLTCNEFFTSERLYSVFDANKLHPWQSGLPEAGSRKDRIDSTIKYLMGKSLVSGESALILLLQELAMRSSPGTQRYSELQNLIKMCKSEINSQSWVPSYEDAPNPQIMMEEEWIDRRQQLYQLESIKFDSLCMDYFPDVYAGFWSGMREDEKVNLLLNYCWQNLSAKKQLDTLLRIEFKKNNLPLHNLPQPDYTSFVGREMELKWLRDGLSPDDPVWQMAITGIGGVGKSALALEIAHEYRRYYEYLPSQERFEAIIWGSAREVALTEDGSESLKSSGFVLRSLEDVYRMIGRVLDREDIVNADPEKQSWLVNRALREQRTLLILDNLETLRDENVKKFLRRLPAPTTKAIITSREWVNVAEIRTLTGFSLEESDRLISQEAAARDVVLDDMQRERIFELTSGLPLPMKLAVGRLSSGESFDQVIRWLGDGEGDLTEYCIKGQVDFVLNRDAQARATLMTCSLFDRNAGGSRDVIRKIADINSADLDRTLSLLQRFFLVNQTDDDDFWVLPIVQRYVRILIETTETGKKIIERKAAWESSNSFNSEYFETIDPEKKWVFQEPLKKERPDLAILIRQRAEAVGVFWKAPYGEPIWCDVPAGEFWMGSKNMVDEQPLHLVYLNRYGIAKTPVTNSQYQIFLEATKHKVPEHWQDGKFLQGQENYPVVNVSWNDAVAYCKWLSDMTGKNIQLPSEAEWEKAARGDQDKREYPWGKWASGRANTAELGLNDTTPVGIFPEGMSFYGVLDMSGNVWQWTRSVYENYPYHDNDGREDLHSRKYASVVLRGGAFNNVESYARCSCRGWHDPLFRSLSYGFRVCCYQIWDG